MTVGVFLIMFGHDSWQLYNVILLLKYNAIQLFAMATIVINYIWKKKTTVIYDYFTLY